LVSKNLVIRSQGAVIWNDKSNLYKENVYFRTEQNLLTKTKITKTASELIEPREMIFIDTGTTMLELAKNLSEDCNLSVVTNDLKIALVFSIYETMLEPLHHILFLVAVIWFIVEWYKH